MYYPYKIRNKKHHRFSKFWTPFEMNGSFFMKQGGGGANPTGYIFIGKEVTKLHCTPSVIAGCFGKSRYIIFVMYLDIVYI